MVILDWGRKESHELEIILAFKKEPCKESVERMGPQNDRLRHLSVCPSMKATKTLTKLIKSIV
jgi:hypothetical protein